MAFPLHIMQPVEETNLQPRGMDRLERPFPVGTTYKRYASTGFSVTSHRCVLLHDYWRPLSLRIRTI
jgi:hypothetical protein